MSDGYNKLAHLDTPEKLKAAQVIYEDKSSESLIAEGTSNADLERLSQSIKALNECHVQVSRVMKNRLDDPNTLCLYNDPKPNYLGLSQFGIDSGIEHAIGDLFNWLKSGIDAAFKFIEGVGEDIWYFVVEFGKEVYYAVIDTFEAVFEAFEWLFNVIKTGVEKIIQFIKILFEIEDIKRTKEVLKKVVSLYLAEQEHTISGMKEAFNTQINQVQTSIAKWSGNEGWENNIGTIGSEKPDENAQNPLQQHTSSSLHLLNHFEQNASSIEVVNAPQTQSICSERLEELTKNLLEAITNSAEKLGTSFDNLIELVADLPKLNVSDIIKRLIGILANSALTACQLVINVVFDIISLAVGSISDFLNSELYIPVLSDILGKFSFLDVMCWIAAAAYTVIYKLANQRAPFQENATTQILNAQNLTELKAIIHGEVKLPQATKTCTVGDHLHLSSDEWFDLLHGAGAFFTLINAGVSSLEADFPAPSPLGKVSAVLSFVGGLSIGVAGFLIPKHPVANEAVVNVNRAVLVLRIATKCAFAVFNIENIDTSAFKFLKVYDNRAVSAFIDAILVIPSLACSVWHCYELSQVEDKEATDFKLAVLEEASNFAFYSGRIAYTIAVNDPDPSTRQPFILCNLAANSLAAALQAAEVGTNQYRTLQLPEKAISYELA